jgi:hypothetical protein
MAESQLCQGSDLYNMTVRFSDLAIAFDGNVPTMPCAMYI